MRQKQLKFADNKENPWIFEITRGEKSTLKGTWNSEIFHNNAPITLEVGAGRGDYTIGLGTLYPNKNIIGIDIKGARLWHGAETAKREERKNVRFLRTKVETLGYHFSEGEVHEIWITFPDPYPRKSDRRRRLTSHRFLDLYKTVLSKGGVIHLKTDSTSLFDSTLDVLAERDDIKIETMTRNLYRDSREHDARAIQTTYEKRFLAEGKPIHYVRFHFKTPSLFARLLRPFKRRQS